MVYTWTDYVLGVLLHSISFNCHSAGDRNHSYHCGTAKAAVSLGHFLSVMSLHGGENENQTQTTCFGINAFPDKKQNTEAISSATSGCQLLWKQLLLI